MSLEDDQLVGSLRVGNRYVSVRAIGRVEKGKWYLVSFRGETSTRPDVMLTLHLDHRLEGMALFPLASGESIVDSTMPPTLGIEAGQLTEPLNGRIHAATVRNYPVDFRYLTAPALQDGGELLGAPSFDDGVPYGGSGLTTWRPADLSVDYRIRRGHGTETQTDDDAAPVEARIQGFVPFVSDDYIVQGVAHSCEGGQSCSRNLLYLSHYWKTPGHEETVDLGSIGGATGGVVAPPRELKVWAEAGCNALGESDLGDCARERLRNRSIVTEIDLDQQRVTRCWRLAGSSNEQRFGHVGGLAYFNGSVYVADSNLVTRYVVGDAPSKPMSGDTPCQELYREQYPSGNFREYHVQKSSYVSFSFVRGEGTMMVGSSGDHGTVRAYRYGVDSYGNLSANPLRSYWVPYSTQGVELVAEGNTDYLMVSASEGLYKYPAELAVGGKPSNAVIKYYPFLPVGAEDTARVGSTYWSASESSARFYQRRPVVGDLKPWSYFYPFIYSFQPAVMTSRGATDKDFK